MLSAETNLDAGEQIKLAMSLTPAEKLKLIEPLIDNICCLSGMIYTMENREGALDEISKLARIAQRYL